MVYYLFNKIRNRFVSEGGYGEFLYLAVPLILTTSSWSVQHFVDRMFLSWYSPAAVASAMSAGALNFTFLSFFIGIVTYTGTFVAQYFGAKHYRRIGKVLWQGIYLSLMGSLSVVLLLFFSNDIFTIIGHIDEIKRNEIIYFNILCSGALPMLLSACLSSFYSGIGKTWTIMWVNMIVTCINIIFDYILIFGHFFFPELGIAGAAIATVISSIFNLLIYTILIFRKSNENYKIISGYKFDRKLFQRLINYGLPAGLQFFLDMAGFTLFLLFIGKIGLVELAATSIAFNISTLVFMPMIGSGIAVSIMVGQYLGSNRSHYAERSVYSGFTIALIYMSTISMCYFFFPDIFINPFIKEVVGDYKSIKDLAIVLLKFVAIYSIFDTFNIMFSAALKGAGDTKYIMVVIIILTLFALVIPSYLTVYYLKGNIYILWLVFSIYIVLLGLSFYIRFCFGKWKIMRVIESKEVLGI
jgi:MATE family multidrug resistance protein